MSKSWDEMERAKENEYFERQNKEALARLKNRAGGTTRLSPITGEPMEHVTIFGVLVDRCPKSGYIGLDAGELEHILKNAKGSSSQGDWFKGLFEGLIAKKVF